MKEIIKTIIGRFRSPVVWTSLGAVVLWGLKTSGKLEVLGLTADSFNMGWNIITGLLVSVGIINNPENSNGL